MAYRRELKKISELEVGVFRGDIIVRIDRIISVQRVTHPLGPHRPMIEQEGVHVVVFDDSKMRILLECESKAVLRRLRSMFAQDRILRICHFEVCLDEATSGGTLYLKARSVTQIEHLLQSSPLY